MKFWKIMTIMCIFAIIVAIAVLSINTAEHRLKIVKMGNLPVTQGLPAYWAIEKGYFKDADINLELIRFDSPNQIIDALLQGQIDITSPSGALGIAGVAEYKNPDNLKIYAIAGGNKDNPNENFFVTNDSSITKISDLKGKKLGILGGSIQWRTITKELLAENNLDAEKDLTLVELAPGLQAQALASKQIDALLALEPVSTVIKDKNLGRLLMSGPCEKIISENFWPGAGIISTKFLNENPDTANKIIKIIERSIKEINENPNEARQYLKKYTSIDETLVNKVPINTFKTYSMFNQQDIDAVQKFYNIFTKYNVVEGQINFQNMIYSENSEN